MLRTLRIARFKALALLVAMVTGCAVPEAALDVLGDGPAADRGYLVASVTTNAESEAQFLYRALGERGERVLSSRERGYFRGGPLVDGDGRRGRLLAHALPAGHYELIGWRLRLGRAAQHQRWLAPAGLAPIGFVVRADEAVYLGELAVLVEHDATVADLPAVLQPVRSARAAVGGAGERDMALLAAHFPQLAGMPVRGSVKARGDWRVSVGAP